MSDDPKPPPFWSWKYDAAIWLKKGMIMKWFSTLTEGKKTHFLAALALALAALCPTVLAHYQVDCGWVDQLLKGLGFGMVATLRAGIPAPNGMKSYASAALGVGSAIAEMVGVLPSDQADILQGLAMGGSAIGLRAAVSKAA